MRDEGLIQKSLLFITINVLISLRCRVSIIIAQLKPLRLSYY